MNRSRPGVRRIAKHVATVAAALSALMFVLVMVQPTSALRIAQAVDSGGVTLNPASGNSGTSFQIVPPVGADCPGAAANDWRYQTFIAPIASNPGALAYNNLGTPGPAPAQNLRNASGQQLRNLNPSIGNNFVEQQTAVFSSGAFGASFLPPGDYWIGLACTLPNASDPTVLDIGEYWASAITITASAGAGPNAFTFAAAAPPATSTTTTTTTTTTTSVGSSSTTSTTAAPGSSTTSTTVGGSTTTTLPGATTTTPSGATTTTSFTFGSTGGSSGTQNTVFLGGSGGTVSGNLAATGPSDAWRLAFWGAMCLIFGRMAILLARKPKVVPVER